MKRLPNKMLIPLVIALLLGAGLYLYKKLTYKEEKLFSTQKPVTRDINQVIHSRGELEVKGNVKIGTLVAGIIQELNVKANEVVKKGQILAIINNGINETLVRLARGRLRSAQADLTYQELFYKRQKSLYLAGQLSDDTFALVTRDLERARGFLEQEQGFLESKELEYANTRVRAPTDGIVGVVHVSLGERVTVELESVLFELGKDLSEMEARLEIDESDVGQILVGQQVIFNVDTYMDRHFHGTITQIALAPTVKNGNKFYKADVCVNNQNKMLRPGMSINANIKVADAQKALALTHQAFNIDSELLKFIAEKSNYEFRPVLSEKKERDKNSTSQYQTKYIWVVKDRSFVETPIVIDVTDDIFFEVKSGLEADDDVITDIEESDEMEKLYKKWFSGAL